MKSTKKYTNQTFAKRVDHEGGLHRAAKKLSEPSFCTECGAIYDRGRWFLTAISRKQSGFESPNLTICPACNQVRSGVVGGYVSVNGGFVREHKGEIENLIENEAHRTLEDNPLSRIMQRRVSDEGLTYETTTEHLAQRIGHALRKAFDGEVSYTFSHENKVTRVNWHRD